MDEEINMKTLDPDVIEDDCYTIFCDMNGARSALRNLVILSGFHESFQFIISSMIELNMAIRTILLGNFYLWSDALASA